VRAKIRDWESQGWMRVRAEEKPSAEGTFDYLGMFNHVVVSDEELA
jgi:hypothetical protein